VVLLGRDHERGAAAGEKIGLRAPPGDVTRDMSALPFCLVNTLPEAFAAVA
jgi:hypothetical protein